MPSETESQPERLEGPSFADDQPIAAEEDDKFNRWPFAERVARTLANPAQPESGLVVAIYGAWGEGKTSVLHMIEKVLKGNVEGNERAICVRFNPWQFSSREKLIEGFFITLGQSLGRSPLTAGEKIAKSVNKYGNAIAYTSDFVLGLVSIPSLIKPFQGVMRFFRVFRLAWKILFNSEVSTLKQGIEKFLLEEEKRIVIFIDDIDRLDHEEIHEVFKLVKNTADFKNTTYVLAFDRDIVADSIGGRYAEGETSAGHDFLEKIIQVPLQLPRADDSLVQGMVFDGIGRILKENHIELSEEQNHELIRRFENGIESRIKTPRHARRYTNSLVFALPMLKGEVNLVDQILIEGIRNFYPKLYNFIRGNRNFFLGGSHDGYSLSNEALRYKQDELNNILGDLSDLEKSSFVSGFIRFLFPLFSGISDDPYLSADKKLERVRHKRVCSEDHFDLYFSYALSEFDVSDADVRRFIKSADSESIHAVEQNFMKEMQSENFSQFLRKLRGYEEGLKPATARILAIAAAHVSGVIPRKPDSFSINDTHIRVALFVKALIRRQGSSDNCFSVAKAVIKESATLIFAKEFFGSIRHSRMELETDRLFEAEKEENLGAFLASRIKNAAYEGSLFENSDQDSRMLFHTWGQFCRDEFNVFLEKWVDAKSNNIDRFLEIMMGAEWVPNTKSEAEDEMQVRVYGGIGHSCDPEIIIRAIHSRYGETVSAHPVHVGEFKSRGLNLARDFVKYYERSQMKSHESDES